MALTTPLDASNMPFKLPIVSRPLTVVVASVAEEVAFRFPTVRFVPVALPKNRLVNQAETALKILAKRLDDVALEEEIFCEYKFVEVRFVMVAWLFVASERKNDDEDNPDNR